MNKTNLDMTQLTFKAQDDGCEIFYRNKRILSSRNHPDNKYRSIEDWTKEAEKLIKDIKNNDSSRCRTIKHMTEIEEEINPPIPEFKETRLFETVTVNESLLQYQAERVISRPDKTQDRWSKVSRHYKITLEYKSRKLETYYSKGSALSENCPTLKETLYSLLMDVDFYNNEEDIFFEGMSYKEAKKIEATILKIKDFFADDFEIFVELYGKEED